MLTDIIYHYMVIAIAIFDLWPHRGLQKPNDSTPTSNKSAKEKLGDFKQA